MSTRQERKFVEDFLEILKVSGARAVVYDPDSEDQLKALNSNITSIDSFLLLCAVLEMRLTSYLLILN